MNFTLSLKANKEALAMFETIEKSKPARRWAWALVLSPPSFALAWKAADIITALHAVFK